MSPTIDPREPTPPARRTRGAAWRGALALGGAAALLYLVYRSDVPRVVRVLAGLPPWVAFALCFFPLGLALDALAWSRLLRRLGLAADAYSAFLARLGAEAVAASVPLGGLGAEAVGPVLLARRTGVSVRSAVAAGVAKRWLIARAHGAYVLVCVALALVVGGLRGLRTDVAVATAMALLGLSAATQALAAHGRPAAKLRAALSRVPLLGGALAGRGDTFTEADGELSVLARGLTLDAFLLVFLAWVVEGLETFVLLRAVGVDVSIPATLALDGTLSALRSAAVVVPSGLGVQDLGYAVALGDGPETAAFLVLKRAKELVYVAVGYGVLFWLGARATAAGHGAPPPRHGLVTQATVVANQ